MTSLVKEAGDCPQKSMWAHALSSRLQQSNDAVRDGECSWLDYIVGLWRRPISNVSPWERQTQCCTAVQGSQLFHQSTYVKTICHYTYLYLKTVANQPFTWIVRGQNLENKCITKFRLF